MIEKREVVRKISISSVLCNDISKKFSPQKLKIWDGILNAEFILFPNLLGE